MPRRSLADMGFDGQQVDIKAIAKHLNISYSTVYRAVSNLEGIHPTTRDRVLEAAKSLGYVRQAKVIQEPEIRQVLMLSQDRGQIRHERYLSGLSRAAVVMKYSLISHHFLPDETEKILQPEFQPHALATGKVEGIILLHRWPIKVAQELSQKRPVISIIHSYRHSNVDIVSIDERQGMGDLVEHLRQCGRRKVGFVGFHPVITWSRSRLACFIEALFENDLPFDPSNVIPIPLEETASPTVLEKFSAIEPVCQRITQGVDAWVCASENIGYSLYRGLTQAGYKVPEQIALTGFHAYEGGEPEGFPRLTSIKSSTEELGVAALRRLSVALTNPLERRQSVLLPCQFVKGETT